MSAQDNEAQVRASIESIADRAAEKAVRDTLMLLGIDVSNPIAAQKQFAVLRELASPRTAENLQWLESIHAASEKVADAGWKTFTRLLITAGVGLLAVVTREYWINHIWK
jgi:hypothetical protein